MSSSLRKVLADSHVATIAIAILLFWSLDSCFWALWLPFSLAISAAPWIDIRYFFSGLAFTDRVTLFNMSVYLVYSFVDLAAATLLSRWVYGVGPFRSLFQYRTALARRNHA